jgi:hypothetical protein
MNSNNSNTVDCKKGLDSDEVIIPEKFLAKPVNGYSDSPLTSKVTIAYALYNKFLNEIFR